MHSATIPARECNEALSVKKSAEIAALFSDIKLSQTTDISQLLPKGITRNVYSQITSHKMYSKVDKGSLKSDKLFNVPYTNRMVSNSPHNNGKTIGKNNMYSARNGLYTIQSQSDESRRSSVSDNKKRIESRKDKEFFALEASFKHTKKNSSSSLENSLGYLP